MRSVLIGVAVLLGTVLGGCSQMRATTIETADPNVDSFETVAQAAFKGDLDSVKSSIESNPDYLDASDLRNKTLLHYAVEGGHEELVAYLLENGAPVDVEDNEYNTPLDLAVRDNATALVDMLQGAM
jgi:ankyrin repeat protein